MRILRDIWLVVTQILVGLLGEVSELSRTHPLGGLSHIIDDIACTLLCLLLDLRVSGQVVLFVLLAVILMPLIAFGLLGRDGGLILLGGVHLTVALTFIAAVLVVLVVDIDDALGDQVELGVLLAVSVGEVALSQIRCLPFW